MPTQAAPISLTVEVERKGERCIVHCSGRLVSGVCSFFIKKAHDIIPGTKFMVLDLTGLECVDSMGLGALVRVYVACKRSGCDLRLINLSQRVKDLLGVTNLLGIFAEMGKRGSITHF